MKQYARIDPVIARGSEAVLPFDWDELPKDDPTTQAFFDDAADHDVGNNGLSIPVRNRKGVRSLVSFTSNYSKDDWAKYKSRNMAKLQPMAVLIDSAAGINFKLTPEPVELSKREEECLIWAARGKTYHDIAGLLNLSFASVKTYLDTARHKLNKTAIVLRSYLFRDEQRAGDRVGLGVQPGWVNLQTLATNKGNTPSNGLDMLDLDRFFESANDDPMSGDSASCGVIFDRYREFSALAKRLDADDTSLGMEMHSQELDALWERRSQLARELVDTPAPTIAEIVFKMTIVSSLVSEGEVRLGLTPQCVEECERALPVETAGEQGFMALEPALWSSCQQTLQSVVAAAAEDFEFSEAWWDEVREGVRVTASHQARTPVGLRAKAEIFREIWLFAEETEMWGALQMSYMRDFGALAAARLRDEGQRKAG